MKVFFAFILIFGSFNTDAATNSDREKLDGDKSDNGKNVIYGVDGRKDLYELTNPLYLTLADSTVVLIEASDLTQNSSGIVNITAQSFEDKHGLCKDEKFSNQPAPGFCSGALIGKNIILTAGHCIADQDDCAAVKFIFGYHVLKEGVYPTSAPETEVVGCKSILYRYENDQGADFGLIELDREITNHAPLKLAMNRMNSTIETDTKLLLIGHPAGLPTKIEDTGKVRNPDRRGYFVANTDSYAGNSGSPVFNQNTAEIEGVLVRGDDDYIAKDHKCFISHQCDEDGCRGEDVTKIAEVIAHLPSGLR